MKRERIWEYFSEVETTNAGKALTIVILDSMRGLRNISQILGGKKIRPAVKMDGYESPLHIIIARLYVLNMKDNQLMLKEEIAYYV
ncbi:MAG: hypothetical protein LBJ35_03915 [Spirochaetaceae bacterium]|jgi:hypothetical protein|nr:hypothetical protein [Spirochaetaceae bacterium]